MQAIKTKDTKGNIKHFIKQQTIHTKSKDVDKKKMLLLNPIHRYRL